MSNFAQHTLESGVVVVRPTGRLNMTAARMLRQELQALVESGEKRVVVDLSGTVYIDSSGLGALISGLKIARQAGGDLRVAAPNRQAVTVLEMTNLSRVLRVHPSPEGAFGDSDGS
ncbi:STAS domain-containing protein [Mycolicibacterium hodleri]|uniref:Anti-sigma factor antagonist n=1 Tax=Mycolicibacterium hodleri TaxID=49897 RepID=A0A502EKZ6_9MYCO|nr:STAS domain-containing protein [Mycolicibacterium hodleri]TPG37156.1 anti-sigma factor antagonist [Mycolicibacterium hodleri]